MGWEEHRHRARTLDAVVDEAHRTGDLTLPSPGTHALARHFATSDELLAALRYKWTLYLGARIELELERDGTASRATVRQRAWRACADAHPTLCALIEANGSGGTASGMESLTEELLATAPPDTEPQQVPRSSPDSVVGAR